MREMQWHTCIRSILKEEKFLWSLMRQRQIHWDTKDLLAVTMRAGIKVQIGIMIIGVWTIDRIRATFWMVKGTVMAILVTTKIGNLEVVSQIRGIGITMTTTVVEIWGIKALIEGDHDQGPGVDTTIEVRMTSIQETEANFKFKRDRAHHRTNTQTHFVTEDKYL